jgi:signal transduction histidine kinase
MNASLRTKGILAVMTLIAYLAAISVFIAQQRQNLVQVVAQLDASQQHQAVLAPILAILTHAMVETDVIINTSDKTGGTFAGYGDLPSEFAAIGSGLANAQRIYPMLAQDLTTFGIAAESLRVIPSGVHLAHMREVEQKLITKLEGMVNGLQKRSTDLTQEYRDTQQFITVFAISANVVGAVASIAVIIVFFTGLARDIRRLQDRAVAIVGGYAGPPLPNRRRDEVGGLIGAVNQMQVDLRRWEQQMEVARQQQSHHEKMAAVGSLAAAIGHEVSNPIAAIAGVAQFIADEARRDDRPAGKVIQDFATQILDQTERIARIMRTMATATAPHPPEPELLDLNVLVQSTCSFISYDKRFRGIGFDFDLSRDVPAVTAVADHITQVLMNVLINAADAMEGAAPPTKRQIRIETAAADDGVDVRIHDNGRGMSAEVLRHALEESFTTKPAGKGRGIGLFVCKTLIESAGGRIALTSVPDEGTTVTLHLPLRPPAKTAS